jgi:hypothetical protein
LLLFWLFFCCYFVVLLWLLMYGSQQPVAFNDRSGRQQSCR